MGDLQSTQSAPTGDVINIRQVLHSNAGRERFRMTPVLLGELAVQELVAYPRIAVLIPCHNEEATVGKVVCDFRYALPSASIYVYDNASTDGTREAALEA